jgi:hypothetical protein
MTTTLTVVPACASPSLVRSLQGWADYIADAHQKELTAIILKGRRLLEAKEELPHGDWEKLFKGHPQAVPNALPFSVVTARMYLSIYQHPILQTITNGNDLLPPSWRTLYELTLLPEDVLLAALRDGLITAETTRAQAHALRLMPEAVRVQQGTKGADGQARLKGLAQELWELEAAEAYIRQYWSAAASGGPFPAPIKLPSPPAVQHRCECGHEHVDQRTV